MSGFFGRLVRPCPNCDGRVCMDCVTRAIHDNCEDAPCPECVGGWVDLDATEECPQKYHCGCSDPDWCEAHSFGMHHRSRCPGPRPTLAAWAIPGDTVIAGTDQIRHSIVVDWTSREGTMTFATLLNNLKSSLAQSIARVVTPDDEARRAALHPSFAYPLETQP